MGDPPNGGGSGGGGGGRSWRSRRRPAEDALVKTMNEKRRLPASLGVAAPLWAELLKAPALLRAEAPPPARGRPSLRPARPRLPTPSPGRCCRPVADQLIGTLSCQNAKIPCSFLPPSVRPQRAHRTVPGTHRNAHRAPTPTPSLRLLCLPPHTPGPGWRAEPPVSHGSVTHQRWPWESPCSLPSRVFIQEHLPPRRPHRE